MQAQVSECHDVTTPEDEWATAGMLLEGVADKDTMVRWSAAKGIGRVAGRLDRVWFAPTPVTQPQDL